MPWAGAFTIAPTMSGVMQSSAAAVVTDSVVTALWLGVATESCTNAHALYAVAGDRPVAVIVAAAPELTDACENGPAT